MKRFPALVAVAVLAALLLGTSIFAATRRGLWDPDEPRYAEVAREMLLVPDVPHLAVPHLDQREYTAKPPLLFWLEAASASLTGGEVTAFSARLPSILSGLVVLLATAALGRRLLGPRGAVAASLGLLVQGQFLWQSTVGQIDQLLAAFEVSGTSCLVLAVFPERPAAPDGKDGAPPDQVPQPRRWLAALGFALLGIGVLAKGPVSVIVPLLALAPILVLRRPRLGTAWLGLAAGLLPAVVWFVAAARLGSPAYAGTIGWRETVVRYFGAEAHRISAPELWGHFLAGILPGSLLLFPAFGEALRAEWHAWRFGASPEERLPTYLPLCWLVATLVFFSFSTGKRSVYLVPAYPAVALLLAWYVLRPRGSTARIFLELEHFTGWLFVIVAALVIPAADIGQDFVPWVDWELEPLHLRAEAFLVALTLLVSGALLALDRRAWFPALGLGTLAVFFALHVRVVPGVDPAKSAERAARLFQAAMPEEAEWSMIGEEQEGILFYSRRWIHHVTLDDKGINELHAWFHERGARPSFLIVAERNDVTVVEHFPGLREVARARIGQTVFVLKR